MSSIARSMAKALLRMKRGLLAVSCVSHLVSKPDTAPLFDCMLQSVRHEHGACAGFLAVAAVVRERRYLPCAAGISGRAGAQPCLAKGYSHAARAAL